MTLQPILTLLNPWEDPPNTFRARTIHDMYSIAADPDTFDITYRVGIAPTDIVPRLFAYRNNTQSNELELTVLLPSFWACDTQMPITVLRNTTIFFTLNFVESYAKTSSQTNVTVYPAEIMFRTIPVQVNGPVYVLNNLPTLTI